MFPLKGLLLNQAVLTLANCAGYTLCKKSRFPWKRHVVSYERPCSGEEIINSTVSPVFVEESFAQLRNNYMTSLFELSWQIQNLTLFAVSADVYQKIHLNAKIHYIEFWNFIYWADMLYFQINTCNNLESWNNTP